MLILDPYAGNDFCVKLRFIFAVHGIKYTPLGISIVFNHELIAHKLLEQPGIDVNKKTCESTALHYACLRNSVSLIEAICAKVIKSVFIFRGYSLEFFAA